MAGLSVVLEGKKKGGKGKPQIISKASMIKTTPLETPSSSSSPFLDRCFLCKQKLLPANDIYMYQGDRGFCSVECRFRQMFMDADDDTAATSANRTSSSTTTRSATPNTGSSSSSSSSASSRRRKGGGGRGRLGGFTAY